MIAQLVDVFLAFWAVVILIEVRISDCLEAAASLGGLKRVASSIIHRVQRLHLGQVILVALVIALDPGGLLFFRLHIVDQVLVTAATRVIIVRHTVIAFIQAKFDG